MALASYPGSGNTWTRWMLQEGSRLWTGSTFCDSRLAHDGFPAECARGAGAYNRVVAVKSHYPAFRPATFHREHMPPPTAAIVIVRAPLDAILSFYTLKTSRVKLGGDFHKKKLPMSFYKGKKFKTLVQMGIRKWRRHMEKLNTNEPMGRFAG